MNENPLGSSEIVFEPDTPAEPQAPAGQRPAGEVSPVADWAQRVTAELNKVFVGQEKLVRGVLGVWKAAKASPSVTEVY